MFALVDCNNFYVSCERVFRPDLNGKPVVVLSNNDGCVISRSNEAKKLGIPMGAPAFKYSHFLKQHQVTIFSSNYPLYGDMSHRIMTILSEYTPEMEIYSIDEAFLKFSGFEYFDLDKLAHEIRQKILKDTGMPVSVGIAPTKALAKVANKIAKKYPERCKDVYTIDSEEKRIKALKWMPVGDVWGIGRRHKKRLQNMNIFKAYDFACLPNSWIRKNMSVVGLRLKEELCGKSVLDMKEIQPKKNIATTRSFDKDLYNFEDIRERVVTFSVTCAEKLRRQHSVCQSIMVFIHTNSYKKGIAQYRKNIVLKLPFATNSDIEMAKFAVLALQKIFRNGYAYKKAGVIVMDFLPEENVQMNLFSNNNPKHSELMKTVDDLNAKYGDDKLKLGSQDQKKKWKMRQEKLSPRYTTRINEIIKIQV